MRTRNRKKTALVEQFISPDKNPRAKRWVEKRIKHVAQVIVSSVNKKIVAGERRVHLCNYTDVYNNDHITSDISFMEATASESEIARFALRKGDVVLTKDSETPDDIGVPAYVADDIPGLVCGYHLAIVRPNSKAIDPEFLTGLFSLRKTRRYFLSEANGATRFGLPVSALENATFLLPTLPEQRRIAQVIKRNNLEIARLYRQLELLRAERSFLLNALIPHRSQVKARLEAETT